MMSIRAILTMDMASLGHGLYRAWSWWLGEIRSVLPSVSHVGAVGKAQLVAEYVDVRLVFREYRPGTALPVPRFGPPEKLLPKSAFALPSADVLVHELELPVMPVAEMRKATAIDLDRLTPFAAEDVIFDLEPMEKAEPGSLTCRVAMAVVERETLKQSLKQLSESVGMPRSVCLVDHHLGVARFDFLKALGEADGHGNGRVLRSYCWLLVVALMVANFALFIVRDIASIHALSDRIDAQQTSIAVANALHRRVVVENQQRRLLLQRRTETSPLAMLATVTNALPDGAYVQRFEWDGVRLRLAGVVQPNTDAVAQLRSSAVLRKVLYSNSPKQAEGGPFEVSIRPSKAQR
ncbi:hypothetical protein FHS83_002294 [Rhizomicrobium palustre]|uniref:General secretion pathway protein GspL n=1 Tax=Rhizomicrobium palustre TaxID=189966 RepID=A0A846MZW7_9PROT|nr:PilN domain-containing protein [Rhizomicrobium palustre]NIK88976.1 hypothetical protein [Rhizomicrobium palustre]